MAWNARTGLPIFAWLDGYDRQSLTGDIIAGVIVAIMLVPQSMAYALLAGLPPETGLYASILPLVLYAIFGSSRALAVGPVAIVSLLVASSLANVGASGSERYAAAALVLAIESGAILILLGVLRLGVIVNFLSHPVISGFTSAAALVIGFSQLKHLLGLEIPRSHLITDIVQSAIVQVSNINLITLLFGLGAIALIWLSRDPLAAILRRRKVDVALIEPATKLGPLAAVVLGTLIVWSFDLEGAAQISIVGSIPAGLPPLTFPTFDMDLWLALLPSAFIISFVGFLESISVAKSLASKRREKVIPDRELIALGAANVGAALTGGYPVTGGFSRSIVNFKAGANTPFASVITALLVAATVVLLTPLFYYLPKAVLAAIIVVAVAALLDWRTFHQAWVYNKADAASLGAAFIAVLMFGVEVGILVGAGLSIALYLWRTSRPHMAIVGRVGDTEHFRNIKRHDVQTIPQILAVRVDESLYFANTSYLEDELLAAVADQPRIRHLVLIMSAVNFIDASALDSLELLIERLRDSDVTVHLAEVKGPVMDRFQKTDFLEMLKPGDVFLSTHEAFTTLQKRDGTFHK